MSWLLAFKDKLGAKIANKLEKTDKYDAILFTIPAASNLYD
jgi:hypothetical protein